jgi:hypothetical protein
MRPSRLRLHFTVTKPRCQCGDQDPGGSAVPNHPSSAWSGTGFEKADLPAGQRARESFPQAFLNRSGHSLLGGAAGQIVDRKLSTDRQGTNLPWQFPPAHQAATRGVAISAQPKSLVKLVAVARRPRCFSRARAFGHGQTIQAAGREEKCPGYLGTTAGVTQPLCQ